MSASVSWWFIPWGAFFLSLPLFVSLPPACRISQPSWDFGRPRTSWKPFPLAVPTLLWCHYSIGPCLGCPCSPLPPTQPWSQWPWCCMRWYLPCSTLSFTVRGTRTWKGPWGASWAGEGSCLSNSCFFLVKTRQSGLSSLYLQVGRDCPQDGCYQMPSSAANFCCPDTHLLIQPLVPEWLSCARPWRGRLDSLSSVQSSSVPQSWPSLCDPMNRSMPDLPVHHQLPESIQTHVHWVGDAIQPPHPLSSPSPPTLNPSKHKGLFKSISSSHQVAKILELKLQHQSFQWTPRTDLL